MSRDCLRIIKSKSKVRHSRSKAIISKVGTSSSTPGVSSDVFKLKDMDKGKAKMIESEKPLKKKDQIMYDQEVALNLQAQLQAKLEEEEEEEEERLTRQKEEEANVALIES
ncbi:hypothetical protein Tco_0550389 [Tanacetum coccineum]